MRLVVNGDEVEITGAENVSELLVERKVKMPEMVSVEVNGRILDRSDFPSTGLKDGDRVEFLYFMGGGR